MTTHQQDSFFATLSNSVRFVLVVILLTLVGCGGTPTKPNPKPVVIAGGKGIPEPLPSQSAQAIDFEAYRAVSEIAVSKGTLTARAHRDALLVRGLDATTAALINSLIAWLDGDIKEAETQLGNATTTDPTARQFIMGEQQRRYEVQGNWLAAAKLGHARLLLSDMPESGLSDALWSALMHLSDAQLVAALAAADGSDWRGWLTLSQAYRTGRQAVNQWLGSHRANSALNPLPAALGVWLDTTPPASVAVLVPLSGRLEDAGGAVLNGIIEALYQQFPSVQQRPRLVAIDTEAYPDVVTAYRDAIRQGAELVLGPLTKNEARVMGSLQERPAAVIALNRPEALPDSDAAGWHALSLAPEDEARQIAQIAFGKGQRRAIVISPSTDWGQRMTAALNDQWSQLGGTLVASLELEAAITESEQISNLVGAADSEQRIRSFERAFEAPVEARPRRRQDFDVVFLLASDPAQARSLRPLLIYHYTGDVPVFATSAASSGHQHIQNRDLNDLMLVETPAVLEAVDVDRYTRLSGLGEDAVLMIDHWRQAENTTAPFARARTGLLRRLDNGEIERELIPVVFDGGELRPLALP